MVDEREHNWTTDNCGEALEDDEVRRYNAVLPSPRQLEHAKKPFYLFMHFGMNTATGREWGNGTETVDDFDIRELHVEQWIEAAKASRAEGIILTCKHHDGFCLWDTKATDFNVMNTALKTDVVRELSDACRANALDFGIYLSPWDMHEKSYGTKEYNDFFCTQLTELLRDYGKIFEVWFDGAKGRDARDFEYDWDRYYSLIRKLQPQACISICGPDIRWVGNEAGKCRKSEFSVVPIELTKAETIQKNSQHSESEAEGMKTVSSEDEDLGSREVLFKHNELTWYPAEVDVSVREGWFYPGGGKTKSADELFSIYKNSVGNNCFLLLNVPPAKDGRISKEDMEALKGLGMRIDALKAYLYSFTYGELKENEGVLEFSFDTEKRPDTCVIVEDISRGQRVEKFDLYVKQNKDDDYEPAYSGTVIGSCKIIELEKSFSAAMLVIRQSRGTPVIERVSFSRHQTIYGYARVSTR